MRADPPITKRQLGLLAVCAGVGLALVTVAADAAGAGRFSGIGPAQQKALAGAVLLVLVGLSLLPLGDRPA